MEKKFSRIKEEPQEEVSTFVVDGLIANCNQVSGSSNLNVKTECEDVKCDLVTNTNSPSCSDKDRAVVKEGITYGVWKNLITSQIPQRFQEYFTNLNLLPLNLHLPREDFQSILSIKACNESSFKEDDKINIVEENGFNEENDCNFDESLLENETNDVLLNQSFQSFINRNSIFAFDEHNPPKSVPGNGDKNLHKCTECNNYYSRKFNLTRHIVSVHRKVKHIKCVYCDLSFSHKKYLSSHMHLVHDTKKSHKCLECDMSFKEKEQLNQHKVVDHGDERPFKCLDCENTYSRKFNLTRHILSVHKKLKPHKCLDCDSTFSLKNHLDRHIQSVHENKKPFKCINCDSAFNRKEHLTQHLLLVHRK